MVAVAGLGRAELDAGAAAVDIRFEATTSKDALPPANIAGNRASSYFLRVVETEPGASNVIAREARLSLDVRHARDEIRTKSVEDLKRHATEVGQRRGLSVRCTTRMDQGAVAMDPFLGEQIE